MNEIHEPTRGETNFKRWKQVVGLSPEFPKLKYIENNDLDQKVFIRSDEEIKNILLKIPNPLTAVIVQKGHGATTLCRYVFRKTLRDSLNTRRIPILVNLKPVWEDEEAYIDLVDVLKRGILYHLTSEAWEQAIKKSDYYDLIGAFEKGLDRPSTGALQNFKTGIARLVEPRIEKVNWKEVNERCLNYYDKSITDLLESLSQCSIKPILFFDIPYQFHNKEFSPKLSENEILNLFYGYIKDFHDEYKPKKELLSEIYFLTQKAYKTIESIYPREFDPLNYNPYTPIEAFKILERHHAPEMIGSPGVSRLTGVLAGKFLDLGYLPRNQEKTLFEIMEIMKEQIIARLDVSWDVVPAGELDISTEQQKRLEFVPSDK